MMKIVVKILRALWMTLLVAWISISTVAYIVKVIFSVVFAIAGFVGLIYLTLWVMLIGGIADMINIFKSESPATAFSVGVALGKIILAAPVGFWLGGTLSELLNELDSNSTNNEKWEEPKWLTRLSNKALQNSATDKHSTNSGKLCELDWPALPDNWKEQDRRGMLWSSDEDRILLSAISQGVELEEIAEKFNRSPGAIASRLNKIQNRASQNPCSDDC